MSLKISEYTTEQTTIEDTDRQELSTEIAPSVWETRWYSITNLKAKLKAYFDTLYLTAVPTLNEVLVEGNETLGTNIKVNDADAIELENTSQLKKGTYDFGADGGISRICGVGYEDMWQAGTRFVFDNMGYVREATNCFNIVPDGSFDDTLRFKVGSRWILDDGTLYVCTDATATAAVWDLIPSVPNLQQVTDVYNVTTNSITAADVFAQSGTSQVATLTNGEIVYTPDTTAPTNKTRLDFGFPTATNTITLQDASGTVAFLSDITGGGGILHGTASGTDTYAVTIAGPTAYNDGDAYLVRFTNGNTTNATLNINSIGAVDLYRNNDGPLIGGDIIAGGEMLCVYNSTTNRFQVIGTAPNTLLAYVTNDDSIPLTKGMPVYAFSGTGDRMTVKRADNSSDATSAQTVGLVLSSSIGVNQKGLIMMQGLLDGLSILPTSTFADGDAIYLGGTAGTITNVKPSAPDHLVYLGVVTTANNGSSGRMYVRVQNGYELQELHNVAISSPANNDVLQYDSATSLWKNTQLIAPALLPILAENCTDGANSSGTANTYSSGVLITPAMIAADTTIEVLAGFRKSAANGAVTIRIYYNTTNDLTGAVLIGQALYAAGVLYSAQSRQLKIKVKAGSGAGTEVLNTGINSVFSDLSNMTLAASNLAIDWTSNKYIVVALQCGSASDTARSTFLKVRR